MKEIARGIFTADQSFNMLLIAKAQYNVRKSDSLLPGTVEKLKEERQDKLKLYYYERCLTDLPSSLWQALKKARRPGRSNFVKSSRRIARESRAVYVIIM